MNQNDFEQYSMKSQWMFKYCVHKYFFNKANFIINNIFAYEFDLRKKRKKFKNFERRIFDILLLG